MYYTPPLCPHCLIPDHSFIKRGFYKIKLSNKKIQRYYCHHCKKTFSNQTNSPTARQHKTHLNKQIRNLLCSGVSQRQTARLLKVSRHTVADRLFWLGFLAASKHFEIISQLKHQQVYLDDLETIEHTKLKPVSIFFFVNESYQMLNLEVFPIAAKGHLSEISVKKYGKRVSTRLESYTQAFHTMKLILKKSDDVVFMSDGLKEYGDHIKRVFPDSHHEVHLSKREKRVRQELLHESSRKKVFDPLFVINQRCAKLRADIKRLTRRSWCTTKKLECLEMHLWMYLGYNNEYMLKFA